MNKNKTPKLPKALKSAPDLSPIFSKLDSIKNSDTQSLDLMNINSISSSISDRIKNNENITQLFPDVELSIQILTSSIISPNDMLTPSLIYKSPELSMPSDIDSYLTNTISKYINTEYKLLDKLNVILREALFTKGAYIEMILPDNILNTVVNDGTISLETLSEDVFTNKGYLGEIDDNFNVSLEEFSIPIVQEISTNNKLNMKLIDLYIDIIDDPSVLKVNKILIDNLNTEIEKEIYGDVSTEDAQYDKIFNNKKTENVYNINDSGEANSGKPLIMKLNTEAVIPVHVASDPSKHLGYFILIDDTGSPISSKKMSAILTELDNNDNYNSSDIKSTMITKAKVALTGYTKKDPVINNIESVYNKVVSEIIANKISTGKYGELAEVAENADLFRVMFSRALSNKKTKLLYVPKENVAYYAFDYRDNGTGKSMLEKVSMLFSIRAILLISNLMGNIKNNITTTEVTADLDENDPDPEKTMEKIRSEVLKTRQTQMPIGVTKIDDLVDWSHKVGFKYNFTHPALPDIKIDVNENTSSKTIPDSDIDEKIQEYIIMSFGLTKEMVMSGYDPEFATTVLSNNILLAKRVIRLQEQFTVMLTDHVKKLLMSDPYIKDSITSIVTNNLPKIKKYLKKYLTKEQEGILKQNNNEKLIKYIVNNYIKNISIDLPKPELQEAQNNKEALDSYVDVIDTFLDIILSSDAFPAEIVGDIGDKMDLIKTVIKTILVKDWMMDNDYIPEISNFFTLDDDGKPIFNILDEYKDYVNNLTTTIIPFFKESYKAQFKTDDTLEDISEKPDEEDDEDTDDTNSDENTDDNNDNDNVVNDSDDSDDTSNTDNEKENSDDSDDTSNTDNEKENDELDIDSL